MKRKPSKSPVTGDTVKSLRQCRLDESAVTFEGKMSVFWKVSVEAKLVKRAFSSSPVLFLDIFNQSIAILSSSLATQQPEYYCVDLAKSVWGKKKRDQILAHTYRLQSPRRETLLPLGRCAAWVPLLSLCLPKPLHGFEANLPLFITPPLAGLP